MLFDDNIGFMTFDFNQGFKVEEKDFDVLSAEEGFLRGNMYRNEYKPYKNYTYRKIEALDKREQLLLEIMKYDFAINDLNLCLDLHPDNKELLDLFKKYVEKACEKELEYVRIYGPLQVTEASGDDFNWIKDPWPWNNREDGLYV